MGLSRTVRPLARAGLCHRLGRCRPFQTSASVNHHVVVERLILSHGSKMQWRLKSYATASPSASVKDGKPRGRVSRNERRAMVENYVKEYREMNGMFPSASLAKKEVGGCYYVVRAIIQELKYKCSISSLETTDPNIGSISKQEFPTHIFSSIPKENSRQFRCIGSHLKHDNSKGAGTQPCCLKDETTVGGSMLTPQEGQAQSKSNMAHVSGISEREMHQLEVQTNSVSQIGRVGTQPGCLDDEPSVSLASENNTIQKTVSDAKLTSQEEHRKSRTDESSDESGMAERRNLHQPPGEDSETQNKSSVWQSLRSFANGILGIWKRF